MCVYGVCAVDTGRFVYMSFIYVALCIPFACYRDDLKRVLCDMYVESHTQFHTDGKFSLNSR